MPGARTTGAFTNNSSSSNTTSMLQGQSSGSCKLSVQPRPAGSSGDGSNDNSTPTSTASGSSTPGKLKRAFLSALSSHRSADPSSSDAWDQIVKSSRKQHKRICYMLLVAIVVLAAVGAGGIAAGAKAKAAHQRSVAAAAAARAADRAAAAAAAQAAQDELPGDTVAPGRLSFGLTLNVMTTEDQAQACSNWFADAKRTLQYETLFTKAYSEALEVQQSNLTVDSIQCGESSIPTSSSSSNSSSRSLKQASSTVEVKTVFSMPQPPEADSIRMTNVVKTSSGAILGALLTEFFGGRTLVIEAAPINSTDSNAGQSATADASAATRPATQPQVPSSTPTDSTIRSGSAAADLFKAGGIAAEAVAAAPITPSQAAATAHRGSGQPGPIPLVVVDHDGKVIFNAPDEVLMPESAALNATQMKEFKDSMKSAGKPGGKTPGTKPKQGSTTIEVQLPPGLAAQQMSNIPDNLIPVMQASFAAHPLGLETAAAGAADAAAANSSSSSSSTATTNSNSSSSSADVAVEPSAEAEDDAAVVATPSLAPVPAAAPAVPEETEVAAAPAPAPATGAEDIANLDSGSSALEPTTGDITAELHPNPSAPTAALPGSPEMAEDASSNPATTTFFPQMDFDIHEAAAQVPDATVQTPELANSPSNPPSAADVAAYNWDGVLLESYDQTPACQFAPATGNFMSDALGRLWSLSNGLPCAFKAPSPELLRADPSGTKGAPLPAWETATDCVGAPSSSNSVQDAAGHTWGWVNGVSCAFRSQAAAAQPAGGAGSGPATSPRMDTVWEVAPVCANAPMKFTAVADVFGRLWGVQEDGRSCAFKYMEP